MSMRAFLYREGGRLRVITPYVPEFVDDLKARIPYHAKSFDRESKHWLVDEDYEEDLFDVTSDYFEVTLVVSEADALRRERMARAQARPAPTPPPEPTHNSQECLRRIKHLYQEEAALHLLPGAPLSVVQGAYRALAKMLHPDVVGASGHAEMVRVNRAYDLLQKRLRTSA